MDISIKSKSTRYRKMAAVKYNHRQWFVKARQLYLIAHFITDKPAQQPGKNI